jgi:hypothetical protein
VDAFPDHWLTFGNPDFLKYAQAYGLTGTRMVCADALIPMLEAAFAAGGVHLGTVPIDYSENTRVLNDELENRKPLATARGRAAAARVGRRRPAVIGCGGRGRRGGNRRQQATAHDGAAMLLMRDAEAGAPIGPSRGAARIGPRGRSLADRQSSSVRSISSSGAHAREAGARVAFPDHRGLRHEPVEDGEVRRGER